MVLLHSLVLLSMIWGCLGGGGVPSWSYDEHDGPDTWGAVAPACDASNQSPIDLDGTVAEVVDSMDALVLANYNQLDLGIEEFILRPGFECKISGWDGMTAIPIPTLSGAGLTKTYKLYYVYFHWGTDDTQGSEHLINGITYPMEVQFIHYDEAFESTIANWDGPTGQYMSAKRSGVSDAFAGLAVLFEISDEDNEALDDVFESMSNRNSYDMVTAFNLDALLPTDTNDFARYTGSSTQPDCEEVVAWTVFRETIPISRAQMEQFRSSSFAHAITENFRPPQPLNGRTVVTTTSWAPPTTAPPTTAPPPTTPAPSQDEDANENAQAVQSGASTSGATLQHASLCVILVALVAVCQLF